MSEPDSDILTAFVCAVFVVLVLAVGAIALIFRGKLP